MPGFLSSLLGSLLAGAGSLLGGRGGGSLSRNFAANDSAFAKSQNEVLKMLQDALDVPLSDLQSESVSSNLSNLPGILQLGRAFSDMFTDVSLESGEKGVDFLNENTLESAKALGLDLPGLSQLLQMGSSEELTRANSLIDGTWFDTATGQQAKENLFQNLAPYLSEGGLDAANSTFSGAAGNNEVDKITQFLRNAESLSVYGDQLKNQALGRFGSLFNTGIQYGGTTAATGLQFGQNAGQVAVDVGKTQLVTPQDAIHLNDNQINAALQLANLNASTYGSMAAGQAGYPNSLFGGGGGGFASLIGQGVAGAVGSIFGKPKTGGSLFS